MKEILKSIDDKIDELTGHLARIKHAKDILVKGAINKIVPFVGTKKKSKVSKGSTVGGTFDIVRNALKDGIIQSKDIREKTGLSAVQVSNTLSRFRHAGEVKRTKKGWNLIKK